jgi:hypothetical protein
MRDGVVPADEAGVDSLGGLNSLAGRKTVNRMESTPKGCNWNAKKASPLSFGDGQGYKFGVGGCPFLDFFSLYFCRIPVKFSRNS